MWQKYIYLGSIWPHLVWSSPVRHSCPPFVTDIEYYNRLSDVDSDGIHDVLKKKKNTGERCKMCSVYLMLDVVSNCCWAKMQDVVSV